MIQPTEIRIGNNFEYNTSEGWEKNVIDVEDILACVHQNKYFNEAYRPIPITEDILLNYEGFEKQKSKIIDSFSINISWSEKVYKVLSLTIEPGNQYVYIREQNDELPDDRMADNIVCIFNGDIHGELWLHKIQNIYNSNSGGKELTLKS